MRDASGCQKYTSMSHLCIYAIQISHPKNICNLADICVSRRVTFNRDDAREVEIQREDRAAGYVIYRYC